MYPYNQMYRRPEDELAIAVLNWGLILFGSIYIVSVLGTHLFLQYVVNPHLLEGKLDEDDNLVVLASAGLWTLLVGVFVPLAFAAGTAWGLLVGLGIVIWTWWQVDTPTFEPVPGFTEVTGLPGEHYLPSLESAQEERDLTLNELEKMILGTRFEEVERDSSPNGRQPAAAAAAQPNESSGPII